MPKINDKETESNIQESPPPTIKAHALNAIYEFSLFTDEGGQQKYRATKIFEDEKWRVVAENESRPILSIITAKANQAASWR